MQKVFRTVETKKYRQDSKTLPSKMETPWANQREAQEADVMEGRPTNLSSPMQRAKHNRSKIPRKPLGCQALRGFSVVIAFVTKYRSGPRVVGVIRVEIKPSRIGQGNVISRRSTVDNLFQTGDKFHLRLALLNHLFDVFARIEPRRCSELATVGAAT
jgi:hypothetical protein